MNSENDDQLIILADTLGKILQRIHQHLAVAESCTGGWLSQIITATPGSSKHFDRGFITYNNTAKQEMLNVSANTLGEFTAVSEEVAIEMATGALANSHADFAISITGIAGPEGGTPEKPVGLVWFGFASKNNFSNAVHKIFPGNRQQIRRQAVHFSLEYAIKLLS